MLKREHDAGPIEDTCAACPQPSEFAVWGEKLCVECCARLMRFEPFTEASIGLPGHSGFCTEAKRRTRAWVQMQRREAA